MTTEERHLFNTLKTEIVLQFQKNHAVADDISKWKGQDIVLFQEDLFLNIKTRVSEKWFYTYFKNQPKKLPRIDMLNMLCSYCGYKNWNDFKAKHATNNYKKNKHLIKIGALVLLVTLMVWGYLNWSKNTFVFCFLDEDRNEAITSILDIKILQHQQSPLYLKTDSTGCFSFKTNSDKVRFVVQSPFYKTDTIIRHLSSRKNNTVKLRTDDYALMLEYYTNGNTQDYEKRKQALQAMFDDEVVIYELFKNNVGVEIYSKDEFIRKMTIPTNQLKRIKILSKEFENEKIVKLKFIVE